MASKSGRAVNARCLTRYAFKPDKPYRKMKSTWVFFPAGGATAAPPGVDVGGPPGGGSANIPSMRSISFSSFIALSAAASFRLKRPYRGKRRRNDHTQAGFSRQSGRIFPTPRPDFPAYSPFKQLPDHARFLRASASGY